MASLANVTPGASFPGLLKTIDNASIGLTAAVSQVTDGCGNASQVYISSTILNNRGAAANAESTIFGEDAGGTGTGTGNSLFGYQAGYSNCTGTCNIAIGRKAMSGLNSGTKNIAIGIDSMRYGAVTGSDNVAIGTCSMANSVANRWNVGVGLQAMQSIVASEYNTAVGVRAMQSFQCSGTRNSGFGYQALPNLTTGSNNIGVGSNAGGGITTGSFNTVLGGVTGLTGALANHVIIGDGAGNNRMMIDNNGNANIGSGMVCLNARLGVQGSGATSSTTSFLVTNSAGATAMQVLDDRTVTVAGTLAINNTVTASVGTPSTHKIAINIGGSTYYLLATNV